MYVVMQLTRTENPLYCPSPSTDGHRSLTLQMPSQLSISLSLSVSHGDFKVPNQNPKFSPFFSRLELERSSPFLEKVRALFFLFFLADRYPSLTILGFWVNGLVISPMYLAIVYTFIFFLC